MNDGVDDYIKNVIALGDEGSRFLAVKSAPTLKNSEHVRILSDGMNGVVVCNIPGGYYGVVHSTGGDPRIRNIEDYSASMVDRLVRQAKDLGAEPLAIADVIDSNTGDLGLLGRIMDSIVQQANFYKLPIINGENAILGDRIAMDANVTGTMISIVGPWIREYQGPEGFPVSHSLRGNNYVVFDPQGMPIYMNSDGIGTKTEFYERLLDVSYSGSRIADAFREWLGMKYFGNAVNDSAAMKLDDLIKIGARAVALSDVVETKGRIPMMPLRRAAKRFSRYGVEYALQHEDVGERLRGFRDDTPAFNISGSAVSLLDKRHLENPLIPQAGDYLIYIADTPNPRSNGITSLRKIMVDRMGNEWHKTPEGREMLEYLSMPSTVLYPLFGKLLGKGLATSFYHMSGGAYNGKLARPLAKHGLHITFENEFNLDDRLVNLMEEADIKWKDAFGKWPMGVDGFITTTDPDKALAMIWQRGYNAGIIGTLEKAVDGRTGVDLKYYDVYFSGKD